MRLLFLVLFLDLLSFAIIVPLLPFMALDLGAEPQEVTLLIATFSAMQLFFAPFWGRASDLWGRKPVLVISVAGSVLALLLLAFADALWMLFAARAVAGVLNGNITASQAYVADITSEENRARGMGLIGAAFALGFVIGPGIGATLSGDPADPDYLTPCLLAAALAGVATLVTALFLPESSAPETRAAARRAGPSEGRLRLWLAALSFPNVALITLTMFLVGYTFSNMESTFALWAEVRLDWGPRQVGYLFVYAGLVAAVFQGGLVGPLARRFGEARLVAAAAVLLGLGMALISLSHGLPTLLAAMFCLAAGIGLGNSALQSLISRLSGAARSGGALGLGQAANSTARVVGPATAGFAFERIGIGAPYVIGAAVMVAVFGLALVLARRVAERTAR